MSSSRSNGSTKPTIKAVCSGVTPTADMTSTRVFLEKIPYFVFIPFTLVMIILCIWKRLSLIPVLGVMCCTYLMTSLGWTNWFRFAIWLIVGLIVYFFYSYTHSHLHKVEAAGEA